MGYFTALKGELVTYMDDQQIERTYQAYVFARNAHRGQKRLTGEAYITHPVAAARILAEIHMDVDSIMATLLHDVLEDTRATKSELASHFGENVANLVDGVSKLKKIKFDSHAEEQAENFRKMVLAMVRDIRVVIVKLADRLHNMRTLSVMRPDKQRRIALETMEIYAPIAHRLGMHDFYRELEDLGLKARYPMRYRVLSDSIKRVHGNRKRMLREIENNICEALSRNGLSQGQVLGRRKNLCSIYKKMRFKKISFNDVMDVFGFRVVVQDVDACYRVLGIVHSLYKPVPERFKDYIAMPKANSYQSLHTTLFGPYGIPIEIQIRTDDMDKIAENGVAAHWRYKAGSDHAKDAQLKAVKWVQGLLEMQHNTASSLEFIESVKSDLFPDEVYVFTPKGDILKLPGGATPVDFAYAVHSEVGNSCVAVKINKKLSPLSTPLINGQQVDVVTSDQATPNPAWLNFVVTSKARSNIRYYLKCQQNTESIALGSRLLTLALQKFSKNFADIPKEAMQSLLKVLGYKNREELLEAIGLGHQTASLIAQRLLYGLQIEYTEDNTIPALYIKGTEGMVVRFAECCRPLPGDSIIGQSNPGQGILVHMAQCSKVSSLTYDAKKIIYIRWEDEVAGDFKADLVIEVANQRRVLALLAGIIADEDSNIDNILVDPKDGQHNKVSLTITVNHRRHLAKIIRQIRRLEPVVKVIRTKG